MNSQHAAAAAKEERPILFKGQGGTEQVFRRIKALTYTYHPQKKVSLLLEDRKFQQSNIWAGLNQVEVIGSCGECPETDKRKCGGCIYNAHKRDNFTCRECAACANFCNDCKGWNGGKLCDKYGSCFSCMNSDEYICCDVCIYSKGSTDNDES